MAAYQGAGWMDRTDVPWTYSAPHEWGRLRRATVRPPSPHWPAPEQGWNAIQYLAPVDFGRIGDELCALRDVLTSLGVRVDLLAEHGDEAGGPAYNAMFARDAYWSTPWGVVPARFASEVRAPEEGPTRSYLDSVAAPILTTLPMGTFEGADALWLSDDTVLLGVGNRTSRGAARFLRAVLAELSVHLTQVPLPRSVQHLLGIVQLLGNRLAAVRTDIAPGALVDCLKAHGHALIELGESEEIVERQAMNVVVVGDRQVIMPADCPETWERFESSGVAVETVGCAELRSAAGGLACATGILQRSEATVPE